MATRRPMIGANKWRESNSNFETTGTVWSCASADSTALHRVRQPLSQMHIRVSSRHSPGYLGDDYRVSSRQCPGYRVYKVHGITWTLFSVSGGYYSRYLVDKGPRYLVAIVPGIWLGKRFNTWTEETRWESKLRFMSLGFRVLNG